MDITITLSDLSPELRTALGGADHISFSAVDKDERTILRDEFACGKDAAFLAVTAADYAREALAMAAAPQDAPTARQKPGEPSKQGSPEQGKFKPGDCVEALFYREWVRGTFVGYADHRPNWCSIIVDGDASGDSFILGTSTSKVRKCA